MAQTPSSSVMRGDAGVSKSIQRAKSLVQWLFDIDANNQVQWPSSIPQVCYLTWPTRRAWMLGRVGYSQGRSLGHPTALQLISGCTALQSCLSSCVSVIAPPEKHEFCSFAGVFFFLFLLCYFYSGLNWCLICLFSLLASNNNSLSSHCFAWSFFLLLS